MSKQCTAPDCTRPVFGGKMCKYHQFLRTDKPPKGARPLAPKLAKQRTTYRKARIKFLQDHPVCEMMVVPECQYFATDIHHPAGRLGENLNNLDECIAGCRTCHKWVEEHPLEAKELNLSVSRLNKAS